MPLFPRVLILGASGRLGAAISRRLRLHHDVLTPSHGALDLARPEELESVVRSLSFDTVINCAAITSPDLCEDDPASAQTVNAAAPVILAGLCREKGARFIHISTDYVFSGDGDSPLDEEAPVGPLSVYGHSKLVAERGVLAADSSALVARVSWLFGPDKPAFPDAILRTARAGQPVFAIADKWSTPTSTEDLAEWIELLCTRHASLSGILHLCNSGAATWQEYAQATVDLAVELGLLRRPVLVQGQPLAGFPHFRAQRPRFTPMSNALFSARTGIIPDPWQVALRRLLATQYSQEKAAAAN